MAKVDLYVSRGAMELVSMLAAGEGRRWGLVRKCSIRGPSKNPFS